MLWFLLHLESRGLVSEDLPRLNTQVPWLIPNNGFFA